MTLYPLSIVFLVSLCSFSQDQVSGSSMTGSVTVGVTPVCHEVTIMPLPVSDLLAEQASGEGATNSFFHYMLCYDVQKLPVPQMSCTETIRKKTDFSSGLALGTGCVGFGEIEWIPGGDVTPSTTAFLNQDGDELLRWVVQ
jgi:hypothetical protein